MALTEKKMGIQALIGKFDLLNEIVLSKKLFSLLMCGDTFAKISNTGKR